VWSSYKKKHSKKGKEKWKDSINKKIKRKQATTQPRRTIDITDFYQHAKFTESLSKNPKIFLIFLKP
jgi:hypothetical protein